MKASDLPSLDSITDPTLIIPQEEIDHINDLYAEIRRYARRSVKGAMEIGDWFIDARRRIGPHLNFHSWTTAKFPKIPFSNIYRFQQLAANREYLSAIIAEESFPSISGAIRIISQKGKMAKPRVRAVVVKPDADPIVLLEAKLKNFVIQLWMLRYLQTEIEGLIEAIKLNPEQMRKVLHYVCKEHHEVKEEVLRTFQPPKLKIVPKNGA